MSSKSTAKNNKKISNNSLNTLNLVSKVQKKISNINNQEPILYKAFSPKLI